MINIDDIFVGQRTCVLIKDGFETYFSDERGIKPMIDFIDRGLDLKGYSVYDLIVGKAAALLFIYAGINYVYGKVMSTSAVNVLNRHGIKYDYGTLVDKIINRQGNDICPMEKATLDTNNPIEAYHILKAKIKN